MYRLTNTELVQRISDGAFIPVDEGNSDYSAYLSWRARGNSPELAVEAPGPSAQEQIEALEREHMAPQWQREFTLGSMEREAVELGAGQGLTPEQSIAMLRAKNPGYRRLKELHEQIDALRAAQ